MRLNSSTLFEDGVKLAKEQAVASAVLDQFGIVAAELRVGLVQMLQRSLDGTDQEGDLIRIERWEIAHIQLAARGAPRYSGDKSGR